jgi:hypothetical protein
LVKRKYKRYHQRWKIFFVKVKDKIKNNPIKINTKHSSNRDMTTGKGIGAVPL